MPFNLTPWAIAWALVTTGVLVLYGLRLYVARGERGGIFIIKGEEPELQHQVQIATRLARIDWWGKTLTVLSVVLVVILGSCWLYNGWLTMK